METGRRPRPRILEMDASPQINHANPSSGGSQEPLGQKPHRRESTASRETEPDRPLPELGWPCTPACLLLLPTEACMQGSLRSLCLPGTLVHVCSCVHTHTYHTHTYPAILGHRTVNLSPLPEGKLRSEERKLGITGKWCIFSG